MANYNGEKFLAEAIQSVVDQRFDDFEFIIVDDGSTDSSPAIVEDFARRYPAIIRTLLKRENEGQGESFNKGVALSQGQFVCFFDSDDVWFPDKLSKLTDFIARSRPSAIYQHNLYKWRNGAQTGDSYRNVMISGDVFIYTRQTRLFPFFVPTSGLTFPRAILDKVLPIPKDFRICADGYLTRTTYIHGPVASADECWGYYRIHGANNVYANPHHDSDAYRYTLLIPALNAYYRKHKRPFSFDDSDVGKSLSFSVILANHNGGEFLAETIQSVLDQHYEGHEIIIVDDASTDDSRAIIEDFSQRHPTAIRTLLRSASEGQGTSVNEGFALAQGQFICFIESGDVWLPDRLRRVADLIKSSPASAIFQHDLYKWRDGVQTTESYSSSLLTGDVFQHVRRTGELPDFAPASGLAFSRAILERVLPIPAALRSDADRYLARAAFVHGTVASSGECVGFCRVSSDIAEFEIGKRPAHHRHRDHGRGQRGRGSALILALNEYYRTQGLDFRFDAQRNARPPTISVLMANFNGAQFLAETIQSVVDQQYADFEFIIVDNGSTDDSPAIIADFSRRHPALIRADLKPDREGEAASLNKAFALSRGQIVSLIGNGDVWFPEKLRGLADLVRRSRSSAIYQHNLFKWKNGSRTTEPCQNVLTSGDVFQSTRRTRQFPLFAPAGGVSFPRAVIQKILPMPTTFNTGADEYLTRAAFVHGPVSSTEECLGYSRISETTGATVDRYGVLIPALNEYYRKQGVSFRFEESRTVERLKHASAFKLYCFVRNAIRRVLG